MRHLLANIVTYGIAVSLFIGAALFARMRSSQYALTKEPAILAAYSADFRWQQLGLETYRANCENCHGSNGSGWEKYPPLTRAGLLAQNAEGRAHLIDLHLHGLDSDAAPVPMPAMGHLHDVQIAAVLNHVITVVGAPGTAALFTPEEVRRRRTSTARTSQ